MPRVRENNAPAVGTKNHRSPLADLTRAKNDSAKLISSWHIFVQDRKPSHLQRGKQETLYTTVLPGRGGEEVGKNKYSGIYPEGLLANRKFHIFPS